MAKVNISEFSIKVKLDSAKASQGLNKLKNRFTALQNQFNKTYATQNAQLRSIRAQARAISENTRAQRGYNTRLNQGRTAAAGFVKPFNTIRNWALAGLGLWTVHSAISGIRDMMDSIVSKGTKVQQAMLTVRGAVQASDLGAGLDKPALQKLQKQQAVFAENLATKYGFGIANTMSSYAKFFAASSNYIGAEGSQGLFESLSKLGVVYGMSSEKMDRAMTAFTQMASKNQVMAEELKQQLGDVLPGSMEIFARAMTRMGKYGTVTVAKLYDMMAKGKIVASEILPYVTEEMNRMSSGSISEAMGLLSVKINQFHSAWELFSTGATNQFSPALGELIDKFSELLKGKGFQTSFGQGIKSLIESLNSLLTGLFDNFKAFEDKWSKADLAGKHELVKEFWSGTVWNSIKDFISSIFDQVVSLIVDSINSISKEDLSNFFNLMTDIGVAIADAIANRIGPAMAEAVAGKQGVVNYKVIKELVNPKNSPLFNLDKWFNSIFNSSGLPSNYIHNDLGGGVKVEIHTNDLSTAREHARDVALEIGNDFKDLIPLGLSTGAAS